MILSITDRDVFHLHEGGDSQSMLSRYGFLSPDKGGDEKNACTVEGETVTLNTRRTLTVTAEKKKKGFLLRIPLADKERLFGGGDSTRDTVMLRDHRVEWHISNVTSYGPMDVLLSDMGWALILNCTYRTVVDCGKTERNLLSLETFGGEVDFYLIRGNSLKELLGKVTSVTGRPTVLPKFAYGLTLVENEQLNARSLLWDIRTLRDKKIPCDTIGLEPSWMETFYDYTTNKRWSKSRFALPSWVPENTSCDYTFFYPMRKMGMQLSLWLCENYDLFYAEEEALKQDEEIGFDKGAEILDANFCKPSRLDQLTKPEEKWFEHLKKFVDNGAAAFKLDGATQVLPHPDRLWGGKYLDEEAHNVYPLLLAKQMERGFYEHTDRRLLLYTAGAFTGTQRFAATWAGDTGGGQRTLVSLMNYAMCGHSNTSCDIEVTLPGIHYGFLLPWSQYFCWSNWLYPWFLGEELENAVRDYATLRSTLIPYLYTHAHLAYQTGIPILRPLSLMYENTSRFDDTKNLYFLGENLLVGAFDMNFTLPDGRWIDYFTGESYEGSFLYEPPAGKGGALFVREGSVFVTMLPQNYVLEKPHDYVVNLYPGKDCEFTLIEDDGFTFDYREGGYATTRFAITDSSADGFTFRIDPRKGSFPGRPDNGHNVRTNSIPEILPMGEERDCTVLLFAPSLKEVLLEGEPVSFTPKDGKFLFTAPLAQRGYRPLEFQIKY